MTLTALTSAAGLRETRPVLILLHGYGSSERDLPALIPHLPGGLAWASLRAPVELPHGGAAWFPIVRPGDPAPQPVAAATDAVWQWIDAELPPDSPLIALGFSQGGLMATQLLRTRPERVAAAIILGGFVQAAEQPADAYLADIRPSVFWGRGAVDQVIARSAVKRTERWLPAHSSLNQRVYPGLAHSISAEELSDVSAFLAPILTRVEGKG